MAGSQPYIALRDATRRVYLESFGKITGQTWTVNESGPAAWSASLEAGPEFESMMLAAGLPLTVIVGTVAVWTGAMKEPQRGDPWILSADGIPTDAKNFLALPAGSYATDTIVDNAIARGLSRWGRFANTPVISGVTAQANAADLDSYLAAAALLTGTVWNVDAEGIFTMTAPPTSPDYFVWPGQDPGAYTLDEFANVLIANYLDSTSGAVANVTVTNTMSVNTLGQVERPVDLTQLGYMPAATATAILNGLLAKTASRFRLTDTFELSPGRVTTMQGTPIDGRFVQAGRIAQLAGVRPPYGGEADITEPIQFVIGETTWDDDNEILTIRPQDAAPNDFAALLTPQAYPPGLVPT